jgi:recombinational DNA repair ATPase RecF
MDGNEVVAASLEELIAERLAGAGLPARAADLVFAALLSEDELDAGISGSSQSGSGQRATATAKAESSDQGDLDGLYLQAVTVEGFRGIGRRVSLGMQPSPGLTIVAGRNGSGKSSFAEAVELALTGNNKRWSERSTVWRQGWRNLHTSSGSKISVELTADGKAGVLRVGREWRPGEDLDDAKPFAQLPGQQRQPLAGLNWERPLELFRPFLSYSELGALIGGTPSQMYDAVQAILGLDQLVTAENRLAGARKRLDQPSKQAANALPALRSRLAGHADERARRAEQAITHKPYDLAAVEALAVGADAASDPETAGLAQIATLALPTAEAVHKAIEHLRAADQRVARIAGTQAADARRLANLLQVALDHQASHVGEPCPVCGSRTLDEPWAASTRAEVDHLTQLAKTADDAHEELTAATRIVRNMIRPVPPLLLEDLGNEPDRARCCDAWNCWAELASVDSAKGLIPQAEQRLANAAAALAELQADAAGILKRRSEAWQPVAAALASWAEQARSSQRAADDLADVKKATSWLREIGQEIRDVRMAPFATVSAEVWGLLRQESNVELGPVRLVGSNTQRRLDLEVTVDGVEGAALSVMSQGELHALALALFLPRATTPESPFRFLVIDDPVQSMDPAKVDGLARLLAKVGAERQVIVFTHDDRLPEAIRRLQLPATIWDVMRREGSVVELRKSEDPVARYLDDARAIARTDELPPEAKSLVVAGFCRSALEAACHEAVRARRTKAGARHSDTERELSRAQRLRQALALAMLDDANRGSDVVPELRRRCGQAGVNAFGAAKEGTHAFFLGDLRHLVEETARLAAEIRK